MRCKKMVKTALKGTFPCGQCTPCRINKRRVWTHRIILESLRYPEGMCASVTLTYRDDNLPLLGNLSKRDLSLWLKRLRERIAPVVIRFFAVGEYGDVSWRPHYHVILFGYRSCANLKTVQSKREDSRPNCCDVCLQVWETWGKGRIEVQHFSRGSAQYVAGYCLKKLTSPKDERLQGRVPEFSLMSRNPGIAAEGIEPLVKLMTGLNGAELMDKVKGVFGVLRHGESGMLPLGRYLKMKLAAKAGYDWASLREHYGQKEVEELQRLYGTIQAAAEAKVDEALVEDHTAEVRAAQVESRLKFFNSRRL